MRVAMTLVVRDEVDVLETWLQYHFARGVDVVLVTDHASVDGTSDVLRAYERDGRLDVVREEGGVLRQAEWVTRMARRAATEHRADWIIASDADEFWWPVAGTMHEILDAIPDRFGVVRGLMRHFVLRPGAGVFADRLTVRARPTDDLASPYHAQVKVAHRAAADAVVSVGNHDVEGTGLRLIRDWFPLDVLHFPVRDERQLEAKYLRRATSPDGQHIVHALEALAQGKREALLSQVLVDDDRLGRGLVDGSFVEDTRLRDALRELEGTGRLASPAPSPADDADRAADAEIALRRDAAVLAERGCATLEHAVAVLESRTRLAPRLTRRVRAAVGSRR